MATAIPLPVFDQYVSAGAFSVWLGAGALPARMGRARLTFRESITQAGSDEFAVLLPAALEDHAPDAGRRCAAEGHVRRQGPGVAPQAGSSSPVPSSIAP